ncbi:MAG TPA: hypothetical protein VIJ51_12105 [Solirubrobacteraceae bacterium]
MAGLAWLARVGCSPIEPLAAVMGWSERVAHDHVRRLTDAGLVRRVARTRGAGSLILVTSNGAVKAGYLATRAPRAIGPTTWAYAEACAWVSAWLTKRRSTWWSERDIAEDKFWHWRATYKDRRGTNRVKHRPALGLKLVEGYGAIEVETHQRVPARLLGTMNMYDALTDNSESPITGVLFVTKDNVIADQIQRAARKAMLSPPHMKIRSLSEIIQQTSTADWGNAVTVQQPDTDPAN